MTKEQSLQIIHDMINKARFNFSRASFHFILWGILLVGAALYEFFASNVFEGSMPFIAWPIVGVLGGILSSVYGARSARGESMTHLDRVYSGIWITFFATLILLLVGFVSQKENPGSFIMILTGLPTFLTGFVLRFRPLIYGGVGFWMLGFASLYVFREYSSLIFAVSMIQGYLVPGFLMKTLRTSHV